VTDLPDNIASVAAGGADSFALTQTGDLYQWGSVDQSSVDYTPSVVATGVTQISAVAKSVVALENGQVVTW
jgi:alpha-tubulin suppressor-like RCC1 family protein